jgi:chromosomal replication initiation ATPase DnaA
MNPYNEIYHLKKQVKFLQQKNLNLQEFYKAEIKRLKHEINNPTIPFEKTPSIENEVIRLICDMFDVTPSNVKSHSRKQEYVLPRHLICYVLRKNYRFEFIKIALILGRDHSSIIHSCKSIEDYLSYDKRVIQAYEDIKRVLHINCNERPVHKHLDS